MIREKYEKPVMEIIELEGDVITTSGVCMPDSDSCSPVGVCGDDYCPWEHVSPCTDNCSAVHSNGTNILGL